MNNDRWKKATVELRYNYSSSRRVVELVIDNGYMGNSNTIVIKRFKDLNSATRVINVLKSLEIQVRKLGIEKLDVRI